ncbi:MAG: transporter substrate-binding domain-containing protein [Pseudobutyrivibrio ruminis]|nr:transporter substrate-binding domain-containing protein [Pseudobutyrivibrio ruminis]
MIKAQKLFTIIGVLTLGVALLTGCGAGSKREAEETITSIQQLDSPGGKIGLADNTGDEKLVVEKFPQPEFTEFSDLSGKTVSMLTGAPFEELVKSKNPEVGEFTFFNSMPDMIQALKTQKTDAFLTNNAVGQLVLNRNPEIVLFPQSLQDGEFGIAFSKGDSRRDEWQAAFNEIPQSDIQAAWDKWTGEDESIKVLPEQDWEGSNGTVNVAACDTLEPMSYMGGDGKLRGFDLEVILMVAKKLDVKVEFTGMEFSAILAAVQSGKADMGAGSIIITEERAQSVDFLEYYPAAFVLLVRSVTYSDTAVEENTIINSIKESFNKTFIREGRWKLFVQGIGITMIITLSAILLGTTLGFTVFMICRNGNPVANTITRFCLWLVQGMPMVVLLMILYYIVFGNISINGITVAVIGFTLTFGAAVYGLLKIGVGTIDNGQYEAAYALGYSNQMTFFKIILPQALPHVLPAYKGEIVGLIKATAIVGYIAVQDLTKMGDIVRSRTYEAFFPLIAITIIYFVLEGIIGLLVSRISINLNPKRRNPSEILKGVKTDD